MKRRLSFVLCLVLALSFATNVSATRRRQVLKYQQSNQTESNKVEATQSIDYGSITYVEGLPGPKSKEETDSQENVSLAGTEGLIALKPDISYAVCDGERQAIDAADPQVVPLLENGRVLVPLRFLSEKLGAMVSWDDATQTATIVKGEKILEITPGFAEYRLDGVDYPLDVPARVEHGRTLVPVRFIAEAFEKNVIWEDEIVWITEGEEEIGDDEKEAVKNILKLIY